MTELAFAILAATLVIGRTYIQASEHRDDSWPVDPKMWCTELVFYKMPLFFN